MLLRKSMRRHREDTERESKYGSPRTNEREIKGEGNRAREWSAATWRWQSEQRKNNKRPRFCDVKIDSGERHAHGPRDGSTYNRKGRRTRYLVKETDEATRAACFLPPSPRSGTLIGRYSDRATSSTTIDNKYTRRVKRRRAATESR